MEERGSGGCHKRLRCKTKHRPAATEADAFPAASPHEKILAFAFCLLTFTLCLFRSCLYRSAMSKPIPVGTRAEVEQRVEFDHTLQKFHAELPAVLSTPQMIGWMEWACYLAAEPFCEGDEITVGTAIHVDHLAATGLGQSVKAEAVLDSFNGKFYVFRVHAWDDHQEIGRGTVHRAFVNVGRFMKRLEAKMAGKLPSGE